MTKPNSANIQGMSLLKGFAITLVTLDLLLVALHCIGQWPVINLDQEGNLAAWYSSAKLLGLALAGVAIWDAERRPAAQALRHAWLWLVVAAIFLLLSADETASMHERVARFVMEDTMIGLDIRETVMRGDSIKNSFAWVLLLSPFILAVVMFFLVFFHKRLRGCPSSYRLAMIALGLFVLVVLMESTVYFMPSFKSWDQAEIKLYQSFIVVEESGEILGTTFFLLSFLNYRLSLRPSALMAEIRG